MIVSEARITANRLNALRSTGPRTEEGKEKSRANALKHGMCAATLAVAEGDPAPMAEARRSAWRGLLKPEGDAESWLVAEIAATTLKIDHAERVGRQARDRAALRAELCWDDDRRLAAETLGATLGRAPGEVVERLKATPQGCDWLINRWALLLQAGQTRRDWTPEQNALAFDLLGTPPEFRDTYPSPPPDPDAPRAARWGNPLDLARRQIEALCAHRERVAELDRIERGLAGADLVDEPTPELRRLRRHEATLHKRLRWCLDQLRAGPRDAARKADLTIEVEGGPADAPSGPAEIMPAAGAGAEPGPGEIPESEECPSPARMALTPGVEEGPDREAQDQRPGAGLVPGPIRDDEPTGPENCGTNPLSSPTRQITRDGRAPATCRPG